MVEDLRLGRLECPRGSSARGAASAGGIHERGSALRNVFVAKPPSLRRTLRGLQLARVSGLLLLLRRRGSGAIRRSGVVRTQRPRVLGGRPAPHSTASVSTSARPGAARQAPALGLTCGLGHVSTKEEEPRRSSRVRTLFSLSCSALLLSSSLRACVRACLRDVSVCVSVRCQVIESLRLLDVPPCLSLLTDPLD